MPATIRLNSPHNPEPVEFSVEDAVLNNWVEDTGLYLRLDTNESARRREFGRARLTAQQQPHPFGAPAES